MAHRFSSLTENIVEAAALLARPSQNRLFIDVRLGDLVLEYRDYRDQHIHGAVHAQIRDVFAAPATRDSGNLPLPDVNQLQARLRAWGVNAETEIIVYGPSPALAARGWWTLRWAGLWNVRLLDGGLREWVAQGGAVAQGDHEPRLAQQAAPIVLAPGQLPRIEVEELEQSILEHTLIDARDESSFEQGHLPGALNIPASEQWTPSGRLRTVAELRERYRDLGLEAGREAVVYCGGGVLSALSVMLLDALGVRPRLYVGSWSEWSRSPARIALSLQALGESA